MLDFNENNNTAHTRLLKEIKMKYISFVTVKDRCLSYEL